MSEGANDRELMQRFQEGGNYDAFETLFSRHRQELFCFLIRLCNDAAIAEDVSQSTWLRLIELARRQGYRSDSAATFRTYLFTLGRNYYIDQYVRKHDESRTRSLEHEDLSHAPDSGDDGASEVLKTQLRLHVDSALAELPFEQREVITLWAFGFTIEQMTSAVGAPRDTVLSRKKYALKKLRDYFAQKEVGRDG